MIITSSGTSIQAQAESRSPLDEILMQIQTESGGNLSALTKLSPVLLIFLRHFGCAFCRQAISDIADLRTQLEERNVRPVFVHLGTPERAKPYFDYYHLEDVERVSDPEATIYRHPPFALGRQHPAWQFVDPRVWFQWLRGALFKHGIGTS